MYWLHTLEPTHVGAGRGVGFIDLPIMREQVTNWPLIPGSTFKGVWADSYGADEKSRETNEPHRLAFGQATGSDAGSNTSNAGALQPTDARLVCLPVRSLYGTFAWVTCPLALSRLVRDLDACGFRGAPPPVGFPVANDPQNGPLPALVPDTPASRLTDPRAGATSPNLFLGELDLQAGGSKLQAAWAATWAELLADWAFDNGEWRSAFRERFVIVSDDAFTFLTEFATQVDARVKIDQNTKTVANGQLWYEESIPAEAILAGCVWCDRLFGRGDNCQITEDRLLQDYCSGNRTVQIGGKASVGRGLVDLRFDSTAESQGEN